MSDFEPLFKSSAGIDHAWKEDSDGTVIFRASQDVAPMLEANKAAQNHNDGYTPSRELRRVASIPASVRLKWLTEEGWDCFSPDPDCQKKLMQKLDSTEYLYLRTAPGRLGDSYKHLL